MISTHLLCLQHCSQATHLRITHCRRLAVEGQNHKLDLVPGERIWPLALAGHAAIHAAVVWLITGSTLLAVIEFAAHSATDWAKCDGRISYNTDQAIHIACKGVLRRASLQRLTHD